MSSPHVLPGDAPPGGTGNADGHETRCCGRRTSRLPSAPRRCGGAIAATGQALLAAALAASCSAPPPEPLERADPGPAAAPRNLLVVVIDTLRQDHLECYGYHRQTAPNICRLAAEGAPLDGVAPSTWTKPATASLLTGLHPLRHQAIERNDVLPAEATTLAEILAERGFVTLAASANGWISTQFGFDQGFGRFLRSVGDGARPAHADEVNAQLLPALDELREPFFLYIHYVDPHEPYEPPAAWDGGRLPAELAARRPITNRDLDMANFVVRDPQLVAAAVDLYDGEIRHVDRRVGELLARLGELGLDRGLLTVVTSDHGEEFGEHGRVGHGMSLYGEVARVPLIFHAPGTVRADGERPAGAGATASLLDVAPTVLELLSVETPLEGGRVLDGDGRSLAAALREGVPPAEPDHLLHLDLDGLPALAVVRDRQKLLVAERPYRKELFDLAADPGESRNLLRPGSEPAAATALAAALSEEYNRLRSRAFERRTVDDAAEEAAALQALGYLSPTRESLRPRLLPHRLRVPDQRPGGTLGWERLGEFRSCVETADPEAERQLREGWRFAEPHLGGRWTLPDATVLLPPPDGAGDLRLTLTGQSWRTAPFELVVRVEEAEVFRGSLPPGPIEIDVGARPRGGGDGPLLVRLESRPPFAPRPPEVGKPHWTLGVFVRSLCLAAAPGAAAPT